MFRRTGGWHCAGSWTVALIRFFGRSEFWTRGTDRGRGHGGGRPLPRRPRDTDMWYEGVGRCWLTHTHTYKKDANALCARASPRYFDVGSGECAYDARLSRVAGRTTGACPQRSSRRPHTSARGSRSRHTWSSCTCESERQHVVILVRNHQGVSQLDENDMR